MKCLLCVDGVVGIVYASGEIAEPLYCTCMEGTVSALPIGAPYVEDARDIIDGQKGVVSPAVAVAL